MFDRNPLLNIRNSTSIRYVLINGRTFDAATMAESGKSSGRGANIDSAIAIARLPAASEAGGFPAPALWFGGNAMSAPQFVQLMRSYKARFRAGIGRTPAERAVVDWNAVIADAENGLTNDVVVQVGAATGWNLIASFTEAGLQLGPFIWGSPMFQEGTTRGWRSLYLNEVTF